MRMPTCQPGLRGERPGPSGATGGPGNRRPRLGVGHDHRVVGEDGDAAGPAEVAPLVDEVQVAVEDLDAVVRPVGDEQPSLRVERERVRPHELAGAEPQSADRPHELAFGSDLDQPVAVLLGGGGPRPVPVGDDDVAVRRHRAGRGADERVLPGRRHAGLPEAHQQLAVLAELVELEAAPGRRRIVPERTAVAGPQVAVAVHAEPVGLHDQTVAEALLDLPVGVDVVDGRLGPEHHPRAAGAVGNEPDGGAPLHARPQGRPVLDQAVGVGHRARRAPGQLEERRRFLRGRRDAHPENGGERCAGSELHDGAS